MVCRRSNAWANAASNVSTDYHLKIVVLHTAPSFMFSVLPCSRQFVYGIYLTVICWQPSFRCFEAAVWMVLDWKALYHVAYHQQFGHCTLLSDPLITSSTNHGMSCCLQRPGWKEGTQSLMYIYTILKWNQKEKQSKSLQYRNVELEQEFPNFLWPCTHKFLMTKRLSDIIKIHYIFHRTFKFSEI